MYARGGKASKVTVVSAWRERASELPCHRVQFSRCRRLSIRAEVQKPVFFLGLVPLSARDSGNRFVEHKLWCTKDVLIFIW